jgi:ATP-binding cassette subfamily B protein
MLILLSRLWGSIGQRRKIQFGFLFVLMLIASIAEVVSLGAVLPFLGALTSPEKLFNSHLAKPLINGLAITDPLQLLLPLTIIFVIAAMFSGLVRLVLLWAQTRLGHAIGADLSISIYRRTLYQPYAVHIGRNTSEIIAGVSNKANLVVYQIVLPLIAIFSSVLILISILLALIAIEPYVAISAIIGFGGIYAFVILLTRNRLMLYGQKINNDSNKVIKVLQEGLGGIRDVLIDGTQEAYCTIYRDADIPLRRAQAGVQILGGAPRFVIEALGMILIALFAYLLSSRPEGMVVAIPILGALALGAQRLLPLLQHIYSSWTSLRGGQASLEDVLGLLDQPLPGYLLSPYSKVLPFHHNIALKNLRFRYGPSLPWALDGITLNIAAGSRVGFFGATGSGKSTLLDILMGLIFPTQGQLMIDDQVVTGENNRGWQAHIAHVPQTIYLADTSIAENIAFGIPVEEIDYDAVHFAAQGAQLSEVIESWPEKYDTQVGERGVRLSGGQRQRIGIARALYKNANVIILDEATSALDNDTESSVMAAIEGLDMNLTVIIVAHRLTTLKGCDQVIEMVKGKINRTGSYRDIIGDAI